jgi:hypothetical protein
VEHWINSLEGVCSLRVEIAGTRLGTNGKGASREFALASAYAELMERLQNHVLYLECDLSPEVLNYGGFYFSPDEKYMSAGELLEAGGQLVDKMVPEVPPPAAAALSPLLHKKAREWFGLDLPDSPGYDRLEFARRWTVCNQEGFPAIRGQALLQSQKRLSLLCPHADGIYTLRQQRHVRGQHPGGGPGAGLFGNIRAVRQQGNHA